MPIRGRQFRDFSETVAPYTISVWCLFADSCVGSIYIQGVLFLGGLINFFALGLFLIEDLILGMPGLIL